MLDVQAQVGARKVLPRLLAWFSGVFAGNEGEWLQCPQVSYLCLGFIVIEVICTTHGMSCSVRRLFGAVAGYRWSWGARGGGARGGGRAPSVQQSRLSDPALAIQMDVAKQDAGGPSEELG